MASRVISAVLTLRDRDFSSNARRAAGGVTDLERRVRRTGNTISRFGRSAVSSFTNVAGSIKGLVAGYVSLKAFESVVGGAVEAASSMEQYRNTLNVVMKDQKKAAQTMKWAVDFANKTPFETDEIVQATVKLQSYGLQAKKVMPAIGDMAGVMGKSVDQAVEAVADAQTGELERLKEFGITKNMIAKKAGEMYKKTQIINNKGQITDQKKFNDALFALMNDRFKGGMDIQSHSFKGIMSTITGVWKTGLAQMAGISATGEIAKGGLFDVVKQKAQSFGNYVQKLANDGTFTKIGAKIGDGLKTAGHWLGVVKDNAVLMYQAAKPGLIWIKDTGLPAMVSGLGFVIDKARGLYNFISNNWSTIGPIVAGVAASIATFKVGVAAITKAQDIWRGVTNALTIAQGLLNGTMALTPFGWIVIGVGAVVAAGVLLYKNWDKVKVGAKVLWAGLKVVWGGIKSGFAGAWNAVKSAAGDSLNFIINKVNGVIGLINKIPGVNIKKVGKVDWGKEKKLPKHALGTSYFSGGPTLINERGGEIVDLPNGARIYPHDESVKIARSEGKNIIIEKIEVHAKGTSVDEIVNQFVPKLKLVLANM